MTDLGTFTSINGTTTITISGLTTIKKLFVTADITKYNDDCYDTMIDISDNNHHIFAGYGNNTYKQFGFCGNANAVSGNTFTWKWNSAVTFYYIAYGN